MLKLHFFCPICSYVYGGCIINSLVWLCQYCSVVQLSVLSSFFQQQKIYIATFASILFQKPQCSACDMKKGLRSPPFKSGFPSSLGPPSNLGLQDPPF